MGRGREHESRRSHHRHHRKRSVSIPRGFLDYGILQALSRTSMSGMELMDEIEEKTNWRPSPGSVYPLLGRLQRNGSIEKTISDEPGMKRFRLTKDGKELLEEHKGRKEFFREKYHSIRQMWLRIYEEMDLELYRASLQLDESIEGISGLLKDEENGSSEKVLGILRNAANDIEVIKNAIEKGEKV